MAVTELDAEHASTTTPASRRTVDFSLGEPADGKLTPTEEWSRRVRSVGGYIQVAFAALWLVRGGLVIGGGVSGVLIALSGVAVIAVLYYAIRLTAATAPRPKSKQGKRLERDITVATVLELVAAFALPVLVSSAGHSDRDHDRPAAPVSRPPRSHPALPAGRLAAYDRPRDPRRHDVGHTACRDNWNRVRRAAARHRCSRFS